MTAYAAAAKKSTVAREAAASLPEKREKREKKLCARTLQNEKDVLQSIRCAAESHTRAARYFGLHQIT